MNLVVSQPTAPAGTKVWLLKSADFFRPWKPMAREEAISDLVTTRDSGAAMEKAAHYAQTPYGFKNVRIYLYRNDEKHGIEGVGGSREYLECVVSVGRGAKKIEGMKILREDGKDIWRCFDSCESVVNNEPKKNGRAVKETLEATGQKAYAEVPIGNSLGKFGVIAVDKGNPRFFWRINDWDVYRLSTFAETIRRVLALNAQNEQLERKTEQIEERNKMLLGAASELEHDTREEFMAAGGWLDRVMEKKSGIEQLLIVKQSIETIKRIMEDAVKKMRHGARQNISTFNLSELAHEIANSYRAEGVGISVDVPFLEMSADKVNLERILRNLICNAKKYNDKPNKSIIVDATLESGCVLIHVRDNGNGIPREVWGKVFEQYYRHLPDENGGKPGDGLGLHAARRMAEDGGGRLFVHSSEVGKGTVMCIILPIELS